MAQFQALIGDTALTESMASVYAAYVDTDATIPSEMDTLTLWYSTEQSMHTHVELTFQPTVSTAHIRQWANYTITGLSSNQTYYWIAWCGTVPTVTSSASGSFQTLPGTKTFGAEIGSTTLTKSKASVYAAYLDVSGSPIPSEMNTLTVWYSTDSTYSTHETATFQPTSATSTSRIWSGLEITGLSSGSLYYWTAWCGTVPTRDTSDSGTVTTLSGILITGGALSTNRTKIGGAVQMSWTYTGNFGATGTWNFSKTLTPSYQNPTLLRSISQNQPSPAQWTPAENEVIYIWVWHHDSENSETSNIYCIGQLTVSDFIKHYVKIFNGTNWVTYKPKIYTSSGWKDYDLYM